MKNLNAVDFDDLLNLAVRLLQQESAIRHRLQARYRYLLVDEFQDTNSRQLELLRLLVNDPPNICVVGDDDQSIYGWRGAEISNIIDFERYFPSPKVIRLEQNYRSTEGILQTANGLIRHNPRRRPKNLWSQKGAGRPIQLVSAQDEKEEAAYVADQLHALRREGAAWEQCAVLFRMNLQARPFEEEFRRCKIPYRIIGARSFFDKREVKDLLAWLKSLLNPGDDISLLRALTAPNRGIGDTTIDRAVEMSIAQQCSVFDILESQAFQDRLPTRLAATVRKFVHFLEGWHSRLSAALPPHIGLIREMLAESGFYDYLKQSSLGEKEAETRQESITFLLKMMEERSLTVRDFLDEITLDSHFGENQENESGVSVITLHAAKGLEFPHVFLVGLEEGLLPHSKSKMENRLDEERRLLYVGITRAMKTLHISWCRSRLRYGKPSPCHPSSFLTQLDPRYMESVDARAILNRPVSEEVAREGFAAIRLALAQAAQKPTRP
ncbi:MAG: 3'-5' exonuclease [Verrucomicrobiia bacterium]